MTLSKQKGPRKNGPFCLLIFISDGGSSTFYISVKVFRRNTAWRERQKSAPALKEAQSLECERCKGYRPRRSRQKKTRRSAPGNFNVMGFGFYDLREFLKHPPQCSSLVWYSPIITSDYCKPHTKM